MRELKKKQTFLILTVAFVVLVSLVGWFAWRVLGGSVYDSRTSSGLLRLKQYTDTANFYALDYPVGYSYEQVADCCEGAPKDWDVVSRPVSFRAPNYPREHSLDVQADATSALSATINESWQTNFHTPTDVTINGRTGSYVRIDFMGDNESYVDHNYLISASGGGSVFVSFREYYQQGESSWNATANVPTFEAIVKSIRLL